MQVRCRVLDIIVLVLAGSAFCGEHPTAMEFLEIAMGKLVVSLGILGFFVVYSQMPPAVFGKAAEADQFIFLLCRRLVLAPRIAFVEHEFPFPDEFFGVLKRASVKSHGHGCLLFDWSAKAAAASRQGETFGAMTAINFRIVSVDRRIRRRQAHH